MTFTEADLRDALRLLEECAPALPTIREKRRPRRYLVPTLAAAVVLAVTIMVTTLSHNRTSRSPATGPPATSSAPTLRSLPICNSKMPGLSIEPLVAGKAPIHTAADALGVARHYRVGPQHITTVVAAIVKDPTAVKLDLPTGPTLMWVIYGYSVYERPTGPVPDLGPQQPPPGTRSVSLTLVDDATLKLGGNFGC